MSMKEPLRHVDAGFKTAACGAPVHTQLDLVSKPMMANCPACWKVSDYEPKPSEYAAADAFESSVLELVVKALDLVPTGRRMTIATTAATKSSEAEAKRKAVKQ